MILNKGSGRNREEDKIGVMKWLIAVFCLFAWRMICSNFPRVLMFQNSSPMLSSLSLPPTWS